ncbi:MAG: hypothetical protein ACRYG2_39205 [Janthinobacterium lividum]
MSCAVLLGYQHLCIAPLLFTRLRPAWGRVDERARGGGFSLGEGRELLRRIRARQGYGKALVATQHSIVTAIWHILSNGDYYRDLGANYYDKRTPERAPRRKIKDLEAAGYDVTKAA